METILTLTETELSLLLALVSRTRDDELTCDEFLMHAGMLAEGSIADEAQLLRLQQHLEICADCPEEYLALLNALQG